MITTVSDIMNYKLLASTLNTGLPPSAHHFSITANQMMLMHMTKHKNFKPDVYKKEAQGFIDYAKEHMISCHDEHGRYRHHSCEAFWQDVKIMVDLQIKAIDAASDCG